MARKPDSPSDRAVYAVALAVGIFAGFAVVTFETEIRGLWMWPDIPSIILGMAGGLAFSLWPVTDGHPFRPAATALRTALGGFFGLMGSKIAAGFDANEHLRTVAAGIGGGLGPKIVDELQRLRGGGHNR